MRHFMFFAVIALIVGGIYHTEVSQYFADLTEGSSNSGGTTTVLDSIQGVGNSSNDLMRGVTNALDR